MEGDRSLVPIDDAYVIALGRAAYVFARMEWDAVWCCERMEANYIRKVARKTAGEIAGDLVCLAKARANPDIERPAVEFKRLVKVRNDIFHGNPATAPTGEQRLFRNGLQWTLTMIDDAADEFAACSSLLNALLYNQLK